MAPCPLVPDPPLPCTGSQHQPLVSYSYRTLILILIVISPFYTQLHKLITVGNLLARAANSCYLCMCKFYLIITATYLHLVHSTTEQFTFSIQEWVPQQFTTWLRFLPFPINLNFNYNAQPPLIFTNFTPVHHSQ
jgi:hypothetical protein